LNFLAFEKRKYIDYEKMYKKIVTYLKIKRQYKKKGKIYTYISDKIDPNEKSIKSFLRKKKIDIKLNNASIFFFDLENTFKMDIQSYLNEELNARRKSYKRWGYYLYLLAISFFYYMSRFIVFLFRKLANKQLYIDLYSSIYTYIETTIPKKKKKIYAYYYNKWHKKIYIFGNVCFQHIYRFLGVFYTKFFGKIRAFFLKFFIPFQYVRLLKRKVQKETITHAYNKHGVLKDLCIKYGLDYNKVVNDKNQTYKYFTASEYIFHRLGIRRNYYFIYLRKYLMDLYTRNPNYKPSYISVFFLNFSRYYLYIFKNI